MIKFDKFQLSNGLKVILHRDITTPMVAVNICYDVGARDEDPEHTGFAHLFEHLMFGGSKNIPVYDEPLQNAGGDNNAFTNNDITNYYLTLPKSNIETAFWLESDRMLELAFSEKSLHVQKNVVVEEFKQRYLNLPYGDVWPLIRELAYKVHPYRWPTIGKEISHIEKATLQQVKDFFYKHYAPNNAVMAVSGNIDYDQIYQLADKWFAPIPSREIKKRNIPIEPVQTEFRELTVERDVPANAFYMVFHMDAKLGDDFYATDMISDILSNGNSSRMYQNLVQKEKLFSELDAYISGDFDPGLFIVSGKLNDGVGFDKGRKAIEEELEQMKQKKVDNYELEKVKNKVEANIVYSEMNYLTKATNLAVEDILGDAERINRQVDLYREVTEIKIQEVAQKIFRIENCSVLNYHRKKQEND